MIAGGWRRRCAELARARPIISSCHDRHGPLQPAAVLAIIETGDAAHARNACAGAQRRASPNHFEARLKSARRSKAGASAPAYRRRQLACRERQAIIIHASISEAQQYVEVTGNDS